MMDPSALYPHGFHPIRQNDLPDLSGLARSRSRSEVRIKYYFIDFGISVHIPPHVYPKLAVGNFGRDQEVPELSADVPYDPFKLDIYIIGNMFRQEIYNVRFLLQPNNC